MSDGYLIALPDVDRVNAALARAPEVVDAELRGFFAWALPHLTAEVQDRTPTDLNNLRASVIGQTLATPSGLLGVVGTPLAYAPPVEFGSKPHPVSEAGIQALARWAERKLPLGQTVSIKTGRPLKVKGIGEAALAAAYAIAWKIRHHGSQGAFMFRDAWSANEARVIEGFRATVARIAARIGGGS